MNNFQRKSIENQRARLFEFASSRSRGWVRINSGSTIEHEMAKMKKCYELAKEGHDFICEGILEKTRLRPDICDLTTGLCYEIVCSEKEESIVRKQTQYPFQIRVIKV